MTAFAQQLLQTPLGQGHIRGEQPRFDIPKELLHLT
jgi:hypothetical protein